jgi:transcription antitermination factor NusA-like protein
VPEVGERTIEIKALAREPGHRTKIRRQLDRLEGRRRSGACVGVRGSRIKNIVDELGGEKIDIVRWNESSQILIGNALKPAEVTEVALCFELGRATVVVNDDQLSLAIGKRGRTCGSAARLTGWDVDIITPPEFQAGVARLDQTLKQVEGITQEMVDKIVALGLIDVRDIEEVGAGPLMEELALEEELAERVVARCSEEAKIVAVEQEAKKKADAAKRIADRAAMDAAAAADRAAFEGAGHPRRRCRGVRQPAASANAPRPPSRRRKRSTPIRPATACPAPTRRPTVRPRRSRPTARKPSATAKTSRRKSRPVADPRRRRERRPGAQGLCRRGRRHRRPRRGPGAAAGEYAERAGVTRSYDRVGTYYLIA